MKKLICAVLTAAMLLTLCACGAGKDLTPIEQAQALIEHDVQEVIDAIGEPISSTYASSCIGEGEDGEWYYDGFTVYTYRDTDGSESVYDVMEAMD